MSAVISDCGQYRYVLRRYFDTNDYENRGRTAAFIMLNPSTADATTDDRTIGRCSDFARTWGCSALVVVNLYALRATKPKVLWQHDDPVGPENDAHLSLTAHAYGNVVCAWGINAKQDRVIKVLRVLREAGARLWCLGTTQSGAPRHPLYIRGDQPLIPYAYSADLGDLI